MTGHIRELGQNKWALVIDLGKKPNGKRNQKWITFHGGKKAAKDELARIQTEYKSGQYVDPSQTTIEKYLNDWLVIIKPRLGQKTWSRYEEIVRLHLVPAFGNVKLQKLNGMDVEKYYSEARMTGRIDGKGGLSAQTLLHHHRLLSEAMSRAHKFKLISDNPCITVKPPKPEKKQVKVVDETQTLELLEGAQKYNPRIYAPICLAVFTGMRLGEVLALRWCDVDFQKKELDVNRTLQRINGLGLVVKPTPKTSSSTRTVALPDLVVDTLNDHLKEQNHCKNLLGSLWNENGLVFPADDGSLWGPDAVSHRFHNLCKKLGFKVTFHGLRHSHATHLLRANVNPKLASDRLGHSTIKITLDLYQHVLKDSRHEVAGVIDTVMQKAINESKK